MDPAAESPNGGSSFVKPADFCDFADQLPLFVWTQAPDGSTDWANQTWYDYVRLEGAEAVSTAGWARTVHPDDLAALVAAFEHAIAGRTAYEYEIRIRPADGDDDAYRWFFTRGTPRYEGGRFLGWLGTSIDVHDAKLRGAEQAAAANSRREESRQADDQFRAFAQAIPQIAWTAQPDGAIDWYNRRWYEYTGQTPQEAAGWGWQAVHHPEDFPLVMERWPASIANGEPFEMEFRLRSADGHFRWFLTRIEPVRDGAGNVVRWYGTNTDIDDQKRQVERTQRIARTLQEVFLPQSLPQRADLEFDATYVPAESDALVGGDWYDSLTLTDGRLVISIGDVAGHGLNAAIDAGRLRQVIVSESLNSDDPAVILDKADRLLRLQTDTIATALVALYDPLTATLTYASAGHPAPVLAVPGGEGRILPNGGAPLGTGFVDGALATGTHVLELPLDAVLVFYTDGVTEFDRDVIRGETRLLDAVQRLANRETVDSAAALLADVIGDRLPNDDVAILVMRRSAGERPARQPSVPAAKTWRFHSSSAHSAHTSRAELMRFIGQHADERDDLSSTEVIVGELLANTVEHAPGLVEITIDWTGERPTIRVCDAGPGLSTGASQLPADAFAEGGRGLFLVQVLSERFSASPAPGYGTEIFVVLPLRRRPPEP